MNTETIALIIFVITYIGIIFTRLPKVNIDRPSAAFIGAVAMLAFSIVSFEEAVSFIDFNTIFLLLGMMIVVASLKFDGFFNLISEKILQYANSRFKLLVGVVFVSGIASAFLVNDAVVLIFTPIIISICSKVKINPLPYLIAEILSSNIGSVMTITGNPQNMLIGLNSGISYVDFLLKLFPISFIGMILCVVVVRWIYKKEFKDKSLLNYTPEHNYSFKKMSSSIIIFTLVVLAFFFGKLLGMSIAVIALAGASLIILFGKHKPEKLIKDVDWVLLLFFASLFIVVGAVQKVGILDSILQIDLQENLSGLISIHSISLVMSQILSNVPYTVLMLPLMNVVDSETLWLALASASTLAGNATIIGAMANIIVIESAANFGVKIGFWEFFKSGIIITILTFLVSVSLLLVL
ncbi:MAG: anion transporter [Bacteroidales bacterium]|nr:anion transporter [Bacteroidales bacterium]